MSDKPARPLLPEEFALLSRRKDFRLQPVQRLAGEDVPPPRAEEGVLRDFIMSTDTRDRARDRVNQRGWKLDDFQKSPVFLWCHDYCMPPIGMVEGLAVRTLEGERMALVADTIRFTPEDVSPFGAMVGRLYLHPKRFLRAGSVGFMPRVWNYNEEEGGIDFEEQALLEFSGCPIGMNQEALAGAKSAGIQVDLFLPHAEKRLDGDAAAPHWMAPDFAAAVYRSLTPRVHQVPGQKKPKDPERKRLMAALEAQGKQVESLASQVQALANTLKAAPPPAPQAAAVAVKGFNLEKAAAIAGRLMDERLAALTGRVVDE